MAERSSLGQMYSAWLATVSEMLTPRRSMARKWRTLLHHTREGLHIHVRDGRTTKLVGTLTPGASDEQAAILKVTLNKHTKRHPKSAVLRLGAGDVLEKTLQIPDTARDVIGPILENQIERMVPWAHEETRHGYRVIGENAHAPGNIDVEIVATRSEIVDALLKRARAIGVEPAVADYAESIDAETSIELLSFLPDPTRRTAYLVNAGVAIFLGACLIVGGAGTYALWQRKAEQTELQASIAQAKDRAAALANLASENDSLREQRDQLIRKKQDEPAIMFLLEGLSRALPDTAYATGIEFIGREVKVAGKSANATALITELEASDQFEDVRFAAPTTRETHEDLETFAIVGRAQGNARIEDAP